MVDNGSVQQVTQEQQVEAAQRQFALPIRFVGKFAKLDVTPSVQNCERWICQNTVPTTITNFDQGADGQELRILGDGQTTFKNNTFIKTNTGADKLSAAAKVYTFTRFNSVWIENA